MAHSTDIVAYTYQADIVCPACIVDQVKAGGVPDRSISVTDYWANNAEVILDAVAEALGVDRYDEPSYDSGDFPKVVFRDQIEEPEHCGSCGEGIG